MILLFTAATDSYKDVLQGDRVTGFLGAVRIETSHSLHKSIEKSCIFHQAHIELIVCTHILNCHRSFTCILMKFNTQGRTSGLCSTWKVEAKEQHR